MLSSVFDCSFHPDRRLPRSDHRPCLQSARSAILFLYVNLTKTGFFFRVPLRAPCTLRQVSFTWTSNSSASFHRPCFQYVPARSVILSVSGCSAPSALRLVSCALTFNSASFHQPCFEYALVTFLIPGGVHGCSAPSNLRLANLT